MNGFDTDGFPTSTDLEPIDRTPVAADLTVALRQALAQVDDQIAQLHTEGDWESLAYGLNGLLPVLRDLRSVVAHAEDALADTMPAKKGELPGLPVFERRKGTDRKAWDWDGLLPEVVRLTVDPDGTGELPDPGTTLDRMVSLIRDVVGVTPSKGPRVTALRELGLDPDEWAETTPARTSIQWHGGEK